MDFSEAVNNLGSTVNKQTNCGSDLAWIMQARSITGKQKKNNRIQNSDKSCMALLLHAYKC